jgi:type I restriction enzyme S subunit
MNAPLTRSPLPWPSMALGDLCDVNIGRTPARAEPAYWGSGMPWLSIADMNQGRNLENTKETITSRAVDECGCRVVDPGTVVLSFKLSIGKVGIVSRPMCTNEAIAALPIRNRKLLSTDYFYWALRSLDLTKGQDRAAMGATLNRPKLLAIEIPIPPLPEQQRIAKILDATDALRAKRRAALAQLDTLTQAIFIEMFADRQGGARLFPNVALESVASLLSGFAWKSDRFSSEPNGLPLIRIQNVDAVMDVDFVYWPDAYDKRFVVRAHDLLLTMSGSFRVALWTGPDGLLNQRIARVEPKPGVDRFWLLFALRRVLTNIEAMGRYALVNNVAMSDLRQLQLALPPLPLQQTFARRAAAVEKLKAAHRASLAELDALFAALQDRAFRGAL